MQENTEKYPKITLDTQSINDNYRAFTLLGMFTSLISDLSAHVPDYPKYIRQAAKVACLELFKEFPELKYATFDNFGMPAKGIEGATLQQRLEMGIYIELIKAGVKMDD